jgi:hypothetical protein|tara:strand:+ start:149 stop:400 length:252 start_codon:yes stop_codon:yes gene_type:complete
MAKVIAEKVVEAPVYESGKQVEIKHTRTMQDASGKDVEVVDYVDTKPVEDAISEAEARKADLQAQLTEVDAELADYIAIRDAE